jgi:hypothetical protein
MPKLIFGFPVHEKFRAALDLYYSIQKFNNDPPVLFSSNDNLGKSVENLKKIKSKRKYRLWRIHNFLFDIFEEIKDMDFDYFIKLDSDCLFANYGFEKIFNRNFDFNASIQGEKWPHYYPFKNSMFYYEALLKDLHLRRKDNQIVATFFAFIVFSRRAVAFIVENIKKIEKSPAYNKLMQARFCLCEPLIGNLLKDAGFIFVTDTPPVQDVRYRPYWSIDEIAGKKTSELGILYHPVRRDGNNKFRKIIMQKTEIRKNKNFFHNLLKKMRLMRWNFCL